MLQASFFRIFTLLLCISAGLSLPANAQLKIVKDNLACLYGLKNDKGAWVVKPAYQKIEQTAFDFFITSGEDYKGLLDPDGRELLVPVYSGITGFSGAPQGKAYANCIFLVRKYAYCGLVDGTGRMLYPVKYRQIQEDLSGSLLLTDSAGMSSCVDRTGKLLFSKIPGYIRPFGSSAVTCFGQWYSQPDGFAAGKAGAINREGKMILQPVYDKVGFCSNNLLVVQKNGKTGFYDYDGREVISPTYHFKSPAYSNVMPCLRKGETWEIYDDSLRWGLVNDQGQALVAPQYTRMEGEYADFRNENYRWKVQKNGKWGTLGADGKERIKPEYDTLIRAPYFIPVSASRKLAQLHFIARKNGKWGLLDDKGNVEVGLVHEQCYNSWNYANQVPGRITFLRNGNPLMYDISVTPAQPAAGFKFVARLSDTLYLYQAETNKFMVFLSSKKEPAKINRMAGEHEITVNAYGKYTAVGSHAGLLLLRSDGSVWMGPGQLRAIDNRAGMNLLLTTPSGKVGLLGPGDDRHLLVDTLYDAIAFQQERNLFWVKPKQVTCKTQPDKNECWCGWQLIDEKGRALTGADFAEPVRELFSPSVKIVFTNDGAGLYSGSKKQFVLAPVYRSVNELGKNLYEVQTWQNYTGYTDSTGHWFVQPAWRNSKLFYTQSIPKRRYNAAEKQYRQWLLTGDSTQAVIDSKGKLFTDPQTVRQLRVKALCGAVLRDSVQNESWMQFDTLAQQPRCSREMLVACATHAAELVMADETAQLKNKTPVNTYRSCMCFVKSKNYDNYKVSSAGGKQWDDGRRRYSIYYIGRLGYSFLTTNYVSRYSMEMPMEDAEVKTWQSFRYRNGRLEPVQLKDLVSGDVAAILQNELVIAVKKRDDLELDCHAADQLFQITGGKFALSDEGLELLLPRTASEYSDLVAITIPWKRLLPYAPAGSLVQDMVK